MIALGASLLVTLLAAPGGDSRVAVELGADAAARAAGSSASAETRALVNQARAALDGRRLDEARESAARAARRAPDDGDAWLVLGLALFRDGRPADAAPWFARAAELAPGSALARFNLGAALLATGRAAEAERAWLAAAPLDEKVAPLALLDAGLAAEQDAASDGATRAAEHLRAAIEAGRRAGAAQLVTRAGELLAELERTRTARIRARVHALASEGKRALDAARPDDAAAAYRAALATAAAENGLADADRAELHYALGHARFKQGELAQAAVAFAAAVALAPREAEFHFMLGLALYGGASDEAARREFEAALALGLPGGDARRAREYLLAIATRVTAEPRFLVDARVGAGWDSDVPQSNQVVVEPSGNAIADPSAAFLSADLAVFYRPIGTSRRGLTFEYRFGQLAYLSSVLDTYSLQEHDLSAAGAVTLWNRLKVELGLDGYLLFSGMASFAFFQAGIALGPRFTVDEGHGFDTRLRYVHIFKSSLDPNYDYLGGDRDEVNIAQAWHNKKGRLQLGYQFTNESIGAQVLALGTIVFPQAVNLPPDDTYTIPYSFFGHEVMALGALNLPWSLRAQLTLRYEHRDYPNRSFIYDPFALKFDHRRLRVDDRFTVDATLRRTIWGPFDADVAYTLVVNRSTIDFTNPATPFDYDNKNYFKHVVVIEFSYLY